MYRVLHELLPENRFDPGAPTRSAADRAITGGPAQPVVASPVTHRPAPDRAHPSNTIKGSLGKRPVDSVTSSSNSNRVKAVVVRKLLLHGAQILSDGVSPVASLEHACPTARNGRLSVRAGCYDSARRPLAGAWTAPLGRGINSWDGLPGCPDGDQAGQIRGLNAHQAIQGEVRKYPSAPWKLQSGMPGR